MIGIVVTNLGGPDSLDAVHTLREAAQGLGRAQAARAALLKAVRLELKAGLLAAALDHWQELAASEVPKDAEPALLIRLASLLHESDDRGGAAKALRAAVENAGDANRAVVAGRVARAARRRQSPRGPVSDSPLPRRSAARWCATASGGACARSPQGSSRRGPTTITC